MRFRDKVRKPKRPVVVYEILPPRERDGTLNSYAEKISSLLSQTHIDAINIPEVHDENGRGQRPIKNLERAEAREFGRLLQDNVGIEAIVNRVTVHDKLEDQHAEHTREEMRMLYVNYELDEDMFIKAGNEMLNGVEAFWVGLDQERITRAHYAH